MILMVDGVDGGILLQDWLSLIHMELAVDTGLNMGANRLLNSSIVVSLEVT